MDNQNATLLNKLLGQYKSMHRDAIIDHRHYIENGKIFLRITVDYKTMCLKNRRIVDGNEATLLEIMYREFIEETFNKGIDYILTVQHEGFDNTNHEYLNDLRGEEFSEE